MKKTKSEGEVVAAKEAGTNYNTDANRKKNGGSEESEADYFGGLRTAGGQRRADTGRIYRSTRLRSTRSTSGCD